MFKTISWVGGVALLGASLVVIIVYGGTAEAEVGWPTFIRRASVENVDLTPAQKVCVATWAKAVWPEIIPADFSEAGCRRKKDELRCLGQIKHEYTGEELVAAQEAGLVSEQDITITGPNSAEAPASTVKAKLTPELEASLKTCTDMVWPDSSTGVIYEVAFIRTTAGIGSWMHYHSTASYVDYLSLIDQKLIVKFTGRVAEE